MELSSDVVAGMSAAILVPVFMALMRNIKSLRHLPLQVRSYESLAREYYKWEVWGVVLFFIFTGVITLVLCKGMYVVVSFVELSIKSGDYLMVPEREVFILPSLFLSIVFSAFPLHILFLGLLGRARYAEYVEYGNQKHGIDSWKLFRYLAYIIVPFCFCFTLLSLNTYTRVTQQEFIVNSFFSLEEKKYLFQDIQEVQLIESFKAPNGNVIRKSHIVFNFNNGESYNFRESMAHSSFQQQLEVYGHVSKIYPEVSFTIMDPYPEQ